MYKADRSSISYSKETLLDSAVTMRCFDAHVLGVKIAIYPIDGLMSGYSRDPVVRP
jgi:hypothetical protein